MSVVRRFAVAALEEAARRSGHRGGLVIGAIDETGQAKQGAATAGHPCQNGQKTAIASSHQG